MYKKALSIYEIIGRSFNATYWQNNHVSFSHLLLVIKIDPNKTNHLHIIITLYGVIIHPLLVCPSAHVNGFKNLEFAQTQLKKGSSLYKKKNPYIMLFFVGFFLLNSPADNWKKKRGEYCHLHSICMIRTCSIFHSCEYSITFYEGTL